MQSGTWLGLSWKVHNLVRFSFVSLLLVLVVGVLPALAQEAAYSDPQARFTLAVPDGWADESTNQYGLFTNGDASLYVVAVPADDVQTGITAALTAVGLDFSTPPMQTSEIQEISGTWTQNVYAAADGSLAAALAQVDGDTTYALIFYAPSMAAMQGAAAADMRPIVQSFTLAGQENIFSQISDLSSSQPQPFDAALTADLEAYVRTALSQMGGSAAQVAVVQDGEIVYSGSFGTISVNAQTPITADTRFMVGSVTKPISGTLVATLVDDGVLTWDTPVVDLVPGFALMEADVTPQITVRHLLSHSSGIMLNRGWQSLLKYKPTQLLGIIPQTPLQFQPGQGALYNDTGYTVGIYAAVAAAGHPYDDTIFAPYSDLMQTRLFTPLGMTRTTLDIDTAVADGNYAVPHTLDYATGAIVPQGLDFESAVYPTAPASAIWSTATDVARYVQMQLNRGVTPDGTRIVSEANLMKTWTAQVDGGFGLDWFVGDYFGQRMISHNGLTIGYAAAASFLPDANLGVVVMTNRNVPDNFNNAVVQYVYELAFGLEHRGDVEAELAEEQFRTRYGEIWQGATPVDADAAAQYLGTYTNGIQVQYADDALVITTDYGNMPLVALPSAGEGAFAVSGAMGNFLIAAQFVPSTDGEMTLTLTSSLYGLPVTLTRID